MTSRILFVDDDKNLLKFANNFLTKEDPSFELSTAMSANEAFLKLTSESFDVIVADYQLPRINGLQLLEKIRSIGNEIPFIIFTGSGHEEVVIQALNLGADYYVKKGGETRGKYLELAHIIRKAVRYKKTRDALLESEQTFRRTFEAIPDPAYLYEQQLDGRIVATWVNKAGLALSQGKMAEFIGTDLETLHKDEKTAARFLWHGVNLREMAKDVKEVIATGKTHRVELAYRLPSGDQAWFILEYAKTSANSALLVAKDVTELKITEKALRESEEQYRKTLDSMTDLIHVVDTDLRFILINASFKRQNEELGLETEVLGRNVSKVFPFLPDKVIDEYQYVIEAGESLVTEESIVIDGQEFHTLTIKVPIFEEGTVSRVLTIIRDVTEQKATERTLQESEEYFRTIFEKSPIGIGLFDSDGYLVDANQAALEIAGLSSVSDLKGFQLLNGASITDELREKLLKRESVSFQAAYDFEEVRESNLYPTTKSGAAYFDYRITPLEARNQKHILGFLLQIQDITEKRVTEQVLREREDLYRGVVEDQTELVCRFLPGGILTFVNSAYCRYYGKTRGELIGTSLFQYVAGSDKKSLKNAIDSLSPEDPVARIEYQAFAHERQERWQLCTLRMILDEEGESFEYQGVSRDITEQRLSEEALQKSEYEKALILQSTSDVMVYQDRNLRITWANEAASKYAGLTPEEMTGKYCYEIWRQQTEPCEDCPVREAIDTGKPCQRENITPDGRIWIDRAYPVKEETGQIIGAVEVATDITERKQAEDTIRESEEKYRNLVEESLQGIVIIQAGRIVFANSILEEISGFALEEIYSLSSDEFMSLIHPDDRAEFLRRVQGIVEEEMVSLGFEFRIRDKKGDYRWILTIGSQIEYQGYPAIQAAFLDITERKQAERALRESEEKYRMLVEESLQGFAIINTNSLLYANPALATITGYSVEELLGFSFEDLLAIAHPEDRELAIEHLQSQLASKVIPAGQEYRFIRKDGTFAWIEAHSVVSEFEGKPAVQFACLDITDRKKAETQLKRQRTELSEFVHAMAHDLRSKIHNIQGYASLLEEKPKPPFAQKVVQLAGDMNNLLVRSVALADAGLVIEKTADVNLSSLVRRVAEENIPPHIEFAHDPLPIASCDREKAAQIFQNLFENAVIHGEPSKIEVKLLSLPTSTDLLVINDGKPILPTNWSKIFERGFTTKKGSTGLGLAIAKKLVEAHEWRITLETTPATAFRISIPK